MDLSFVKNDFFPNLSAKKINYGNCFNWAYIVYLFYPEKTSLYYDDKFIHAFVGIGNLYFDSECPTGIDDWEKLPTYKRYGKSIKVSEYDLNSFLWDWKIRGKFGNKINIIPTLVNNYKLIASKTITSKSI